MNKERQRIKIAEACGYVQRPDGCWKRRDMEVGSCGIPDYLNDLNAMHDAEKSSITDGEIWGEYFDTLSIVCCYDNDPITATASQRAEAFLKTLGIWEEE